VFDFCAVRFALGLGQGANWPAAVGAVTEWFPQRERSVATGIFNAGSNAGSIVAPLLIPWLATQFSWQTMFLVLGATGLVWLVFWLLLYQTPQETDGGQDEWPVDPASNGEPTITWRKVLRYRETWAYIAAGVFTAPVWWFFLFWLPDFFY